ncbi:MAG: hypothetical protein QGG36_03390, partial [Pirellulaceae bacterium]|nr:hypothetical protein [Pirellulaceae bacterium]
MSHGRLTIGLFTLAAAIAIASPAIAAPGSDAEFLQREHRLRLGKGGDKWELALEAQFRGKLKTLPTLRAAILEESRALSRRLRDNRLAWRARQGQITSLRQSIAKLSSGDPRRDALERRLRDVSRGVANPEQVSRLPQVSTSVSRLSASRHQVLRSVSWLRSSFALLKDEYSRLAADDDVRSALAALKHGLSSTERYVDDMRAAAELEKLAATDWVPFYWRGGVWKLPVLLDEESSISLAWVERHQGIWITYNMAEAAGWDLTQARRRVVKVDQERTLNAWDVDGARLQLGRVKLANVTVTVLPPEGEDIGGRIGSAALSAVTPTARKAELRIYFAATPA